jgi:dTDP-4-amino-4,6-dideoxygalactose transaminase
MTDMQGQLGLCQLEVLDFILERRRVLAERYNAALAHVPYLETPYDPPYATRTWQSYCLRLLPGSPLQRTQLMRALLVEGVATRRGVMAIHEELAYPGEYRALTHTEAASRDVMMLPLFPDLTEEEQDYVISRVVSLLTAQAA